MKKIHVLSMDIIEWYDGFVSGIITHDCGRMWGAMIAFYPNDARKVYVFMDINDKIVGLINSVASIDDLGQLWIKFFGLPFIFSGEVAVGKDLNLKVAQNTLVEKIKKIKFPCMEWAIENPLY